MSEPCYRCRTTPQNWSGDGRKCAFMDGVFSPENWNCATVNGLRDMAKESVYNDDQNAALVSLINGIYMVLSWYKSRGATEGIWLFREGGLHPINLIEAESILNKDVKEIEFTPEATL